MGISVNLSKGKDLERELRITIPDQKIEEGVATRINKLSQTAKMDGYRPGKVPLAVLQKRYGAQLRNEVLDEAMRDGFIEAITAEKLQPAGAPTFELKTNIAGKDVDFVATFEVIPEVSLPDLSKIKLEKWVADITEADIDHELDTLLKNLAKWEPVTRAAKAGDQVTIKYTGEPDGHASPFAEDKPLTVVLGQPAIFDLHESLKGVKSTESHELNITLPKDFNPADLAGKPATLQVKVEEVAEEKIPEVNDEFLKLIQCKDLAELRQKVADRLKQNLEQAVQNHLKTHLFEGLLKISKFNVPNVSVQEEIAHRKQQIAANLQQHGGQQAIPELPDDMFVEQSTRQVKLGFLSSAAIKEFEIKLDQEKLEERLQQIASMYNDPESVMQTLRQDRGQLQQIQSMVVEEQIVAALLSRVKIKEKKSSYEEVISASQKDQNNAS